MRAFFTRERFGRPQIFAVLLLLAFLAQCLWLVERGWRTGNIDPEEIYRLERGTALWKHGALPTTLQPGSETDAAPAHFQGVPENGDDAYHSPLWYLIASAPLALSRVSLRPENIANLHRLAAYLTLFSFVARRFALVRLSSSLRGCWRICCTRAFLLLARNCPGQRDLVG